MGRVIHQTALISPEAILGEDVEIGPYCRIVGNARLGDGCILDSNVLVDRNTTLGKRNVLAHGVVLGTPPQDIKFDQASDTSLVIGDDNIFREYVTVNRATGEGKTTRIGSHCMLMAYSHVAHNCTVGDEVIMANVATLAGHCEVQDWCVIGGVIALHQYTRLGKGSFMGGFTGFRQDLPPFFRGAGNPGIPVGVNLVGMRRRGFTPSKIRAIHNSYKILYFNHLKMDDAIPKILDLYGEHEEIHVIVDFLNTTKNGIARPRRYNRAMEESGMLPE
jgi:UDP-N-acetylglucosamine acyltransferase